MSEQAEEKGSIIPGVVGGVVAGGATLAAYGNHLKNDMVKGALDGTAEMFATKEPQKAFKAVVDGVKGTVAEGKTLSFVDRFVNAKTAIGLGKEGIATAQAVDDKAAGDILKAAKKEIGEVVKGLRGELPKGTKIPLTGGQLTKVIAGTVAATAVVALAANALFGGKHTKQAEARSAAPGPDAGQAVPSR